MRYGWTEAMLDVDVTSGAVGTRDASSAREWLGGRSLATRIAWDEIRRGTEPFDPENRILLATGPLTGTLAPTAGRTVMATLSPRVYPRPWYTHSTLGGWFGPALKYAGFDGVVVRGRASVPVYLEIVDGHARLVDASDLWGLDARETQLTLKARLGPQAQVLAIGPAGENLVRFATVQHSEENAAGHSGFGAVWGSKRLKAIVAVGTGGVPVADPAALLREIQRLGKHGVTPSMGALQTAEALSRKRPVCSQACTFNCQVAEYGHRPDGRRVPSFCIGTSWRAETGLWQTGYRGGGVDIPATRNFARADEVRLHELCNNLGLDLWFRLVMQPWLARCRQLGLDSIRGHRIEPEDPVWFEGFMLGLAHREGLGALFADDLRRAMDELEDELPEELVALGHEMEFDYGFPAHREGRFWDEEPLPFWVISAMMHASESRDPTIGTHQSSLLHAEFFLDDPDLARRRFRRLSQQVWGYPDALEPTFEGKAPVAIWSQHQHVILDTLPLCDFAFPRLVRPLSGREEWLAAEDIVGDLDLDLRLLRAVTGEDLGREDLTRVAERTFTLERAMLARFGRHRGMEEALAPHFRLPCRADGTYVESEGFSRLLDEYYDARDWDHELGWPTAELLTRLGLESVGDELAELRGSLDDHTRR